MDVWHLSYKIRVPSKGLRNRLGLGCDDMGMCCEKKIMIG